MTKPPATVTVKNLRRSVVEKLPAGPSLNGAAAPEPAPDAFVQEVMRDHGQPAFENDKGKLSQLNELFWAHLWAKENTACYLLSEGRFYLYNADSGTFEPLSEDALRTRLGARIQKAAVSWGETWFPLQRFCSAKVLAGIIQQLKGILEDPGFFSTPPCHFIHCANGVLELDAEGKVDFKAFSDHYRSRRPSPIAYDPKAECPDFKRMLLGQPGRRRPRTAAEDRRAMPGRQQPDSAHRHPGRPRKSQQGRVRVLAARGGSAGRAAASCEPICSKNGSRSEG
jgi:hypothetical protein